MASANSGTGAAARQSAPTTSNQQATQAAGSSERTQAGKNARQPDLIPLGEATKLLGVSATTARRMASDGILEVYRTGRGGHRRFSKKQILSLVHGEENTETRKIICYSRVSTHKQNSLNKENESDLIRQKKELEDWAKTNYPELPIIHYSDIGSGLNFLRVGLGKMIEGILSGELDGSILVITYKDRLCRWGIELIELLCSRHNIKIECMAQNEMSDSELLMQDISSIFHVFNCRMYGERARKKNRKLIPIEAVQRANELHNQGIGLTEITKTLDKENYRLEDGAPITQNQIYTKVIKKKDLLPCSGPNPFQQFKEQFIRSAQSTKAVKVIDLHSAYNSWAVANGFPEVSKVKLSQGLKIKGVTATINDESATVYKGISVVGLSSFIVRDQQQKSPQDLLLDFTNTIQHCTNSVQQVYANYRRYCKKNGQRGLSKVAVLLTLRQLGFKELIQDRKKIVVGPAVEFAGVS